MLPDCGVDDGTVDAGGVAAGDLIGINTAIYSPSGANSGVGFAIPVDTVKESVVEIIANGRVVRPVLGIAFAPDTSTSQLGVNGILVLSVKEGGPASKVCLPHALAAAAAHQTRSCVLICLSSHKCWGLSS